MRTRRKFEPEDAADPLVGKAIIVVEIGQAHEGSESYAHAHIDAVADAGADAIKFQLHIASAESSRDDVFRTEKRFRRESRYTYWKNHEFSSAVMDDLIDHAKERGLQIGFSTFSREGLRRVAESKADFLKIGSGEAIQEWFLREAASIGLPTVLSTGLSMRSEIERAIGILSTPSGDLTLLQCVTRYPSRLDEVGLNLISELRDEFALPTGISDHSGLLAPGVFAISCGAAMVEIHGTFTKKSQGLDSEASLDFDEISLLVQLRDAWSIMAKNPVAKDLISKELLPMRKVFGRSIAAVRDLKPREITSENDFYFAKPGGGIPPEEIEKVVGKIVRNTVKAHSLLRLEDLG